jgi:hypothetical protein
MLWPRICDIGCNREPFQNQMASNNLKMAKGDSTANRSRTRRSLTLAVFLVVLIGGPTLWIASRPGGLRSAWQALEDERRYWDQRRRDLDQKHRAREQERRAQTSLSQPAPNGTNLTVAPK